MSGGNGIDTLKNIKKDIIRAVQQSENNIECFATERMTYCNEDKCSWRDDCISTNNKPKSSLR